MKTGFLARTIRRSLGLACAALLVFPAGSLLLAQGPPPPPAPPPPPQTSQLMSPAQLENLVAPVALYPDPLLGQVLAASTYPLEVVQAQQWLQQNRNLQGQQLMDAARQQNWDPSVQALVAFPDVLTTLTRDVQWTTDLGNAFLAQQNDVMSAVQRMRLRAMQNGKLRSTPQENVSTQNQNGQSAVVIEPANPQYIYVPSYNPVYVWGAPAYGFYPPLFYPGIGFGFGFGPGIYLGGFFPGFGIGFGGYGWGLGWFGGGLFVNGGFFGHYGFHGGFYGGAGRAAWAHDPMHRAGVAYANRGVAARYNNARFAAGRTANSARMSGGASRGFNGGSAARGSSSFSRPGAANSSRGSYGGASRGANPGSSRGSSSAGASRSYSAPSNARSSNSGGSRPSGSSSSGRSSGGGSSRSAGGGSRGGGRR